MKDNAYRRDLVSVYREWLITMSITTIRSVSRKLCVDCSCFAKYRLQFCESCGATHRRICKLFRALQSTSRPVTDVENSAQIDA